jgi:ribosomal protein S18 acetylase RimI-like enzyme
MSIGIRPMRLGEEDAVATMLRQLPKDLGLAVVPKVTGKSLRHADGLARVTVAENSGLLVGCCLWVMTYSSWRGAKGIYISDIYVMEHARDQKVGDKLLRRVARDAQASGATFIKLEVDVTNSKARAFYERRGFKHKADDQLLILEPEEFITFTKGRNT